MRSWTREEARIAFLPVLCAVIMLSCWWAGSSAQELREAMIEAAAEGDEDGTPLVGERDGAESRDAEETDIDECAPHAGLNLPRAGSSQMRSIALSLLD